MAEDRRTILKVLTGAIGTGAAAAIGVPAIRAILAPLGKTTVSGAGEFVAVCPVAAVSDDGPPLNVQIVIEAPKDAWTKMPPTTVGAVFLQRRQGKLIAYSTICPHLGCGIDYHDKDQTYGCPCHESVFQSDGKVAAGPSPRAMDELETRIVGDQIEVLFQKFKIGAAAKVPV